MSTFTTYYRGPSCKAVRRGTCATCSKPSTRTATFSGTVNPFNKRPDGTPKSWQEVAADVRARADAWQPDADEFEHEKCRARRLAPQPADRVPQNEQQKAITAAVSAALAEVLGFTSSNGLPLPGLSVRDGWMHRKAPRVEIAVAPGAIVAWARALGADTFWLEDQGHCTYASITVDRPDLRWRIYTHVSRPNLGDRLGDARVEWRRTPAGKRNGVGTVAVDELEAGLLRMGIPVTVPHLETVEAPAQQGSAA